MGKRLRICKAFLSAGMHEVSSYRVNWSFYMLGNLMACFVSYFIWKAVFLSGKGASMNDFTLPQMVVYIFLMFLTATMTSSGGTYSIGEEIRDGTIAMRMIKPISYNMTFLFQEIGNKIMSICLLIIPLVIGIEVVRYSFTGEVQFEPVNFLIYLISSIFAYLINFFFNISFGFIAFVIKYLWGANMMKNCIIGFLSGTVIPLSFLPSSLERICLLLPFASLNYTPVMIYLGVYRDLTLLYYLGLQFFWVIALWAVSKLLWRISVKHLTVQGG